MSDDKRFLARWSHRKRRAAPDTHEQSKSENAAGRTAPEISPASSARGEIRPKFDLARLPPIESINSASDVRGFLNASVPADLACAALRRAWSSDPAIRDFVGLSENSWDFNAAGAIPGFGPIDKEVVGRLITRFLGEPDATAVATRPPAASQTDKSQERASESNSAEKIQAVPGSAALAPALDERSQQLDAANDINDVNQHSKAATASKDESVSRAHRPPTSRRGHGGALPKFQ